MGVLRPIRGHSLGEPQNKYFNPHVKTSTVVQLQERIGRKEVIIENRGACSSTYAFSLTDNDYTKDYPQEDVLRGLEETVQTVESTFHTGYVWIVRVDLVCD